MQINWVVPIKQERSSFVFNRVHLIRSNKTILKQAVCVAAGSFRFRECSLYNCNQYVGVFIIPYLPLSFYEECLSNKLKILEYSDQTF